MNRNKILGIALATMLGSVAFSAGRVEAEGGLLTLSDGDAGVYLIANCQRRIPAETFRSPVEMFCSLLQFDIRLQDISGSFEFKDATSKVKELKAKGVLFIVDDPMIPSTLVVAPESRWGVMNVAALAADGSKGRWLEKRAAKELWRAFGYANGAGEAECIMAPATTLNELDAIGGQAISPGPLGAVEEHLTHLGLKPIRRGTYRQACEQGWAPAPTNDVQKKIWEKIHAIPDKPLKIQFDPAAQKGKVTK